MTDTNNQTTPPETDIMSTARTRTGSPLNRPATADDIVTVKGMSMPISTAEAMGFVRLDANGRYVGATIEEMANAMQAVRESAQEADIDEPNDRDVDPDDPIEFAEETAASLTKLVGQFEQAGINPVAIIGAIMARPDAIPAQVKELAYLIGQDEGAIHTALKEAWVAAEEDIAYNLVSRGIVSREQIPQLWNYLLKTQATRLVPAINEAIFGGRFGPMMKLVRGFVAEYGSGRGTAKSVGTMKVDGNEIELVSVGGIRTTREAARRLQSELFDINPVHRGSSRV